MTTNIFLYISQHAATSFLWSEWRDESAWLPALLIRAWTQKNSHTGKWSFDIQLIHSYNTDSENVKHWLFKRAHTVTSQFIIRPCILPLDMTTTSVWVTPRQKFISCWIQIKPSSLAASFEMTRHRMTRSIKQRFEIKHLTFHNAAMTKCYCTSHGFSLLSRHFCCTAVNDSRGKHAQNLHDDSCCYNLCPSSSFSDLQRGNPEK